MSLESAKTKSNVTVVEKLDMKIHEVHKRYDELLAQNRAREEKVQQLEEQLALLKQEESLVKAMEQDSESAKVLLRFQLDDRSHLSPVTLSRKSKCSRTNWTRPTSSSPRP